MREGSKVSSYSGGQRGGGGGGGKAAFRVPDKRRLWPRVKKLGGIEGGGGEREREQRVEGAAAPGQRGRKKGRARAALEIKKEEQTWPTQALNPFGAHRK